MLRSLAAGVLSLCLCACATIKTLPEREYTATPQRAIDGVSYALPMLRYELEVSRVLSQCPDIVDGKIKNLEFEVEVKPKGAYIPGERYRVDYSSLGGPLNTSGFTLENYANGTLKGIGADAEDQSKEALVSAAKVAGSVIAMSSGIPAVPNFAEQDSAKIAKSLGFGEEKGVGSVEVERCTEEAVKLVSRRNAAKEKVKKGADMVRDKTEAVTRFAQTVALKLVDRQSQGTRDEWHRLVTEQQDAVSQARTDQKELDESSKALASTETVYWPNDIKGGLANERSGEIPAGKGVNEKFSPMFKRAKINVDPSLLPDLIKSGCVLVDPAQSDLPCVDKSLALWAEVEPMDARLADCTKPELADPGAECRRPVAEESALPNARDATADKGIFYRDPMMGRLRICAKHYQDACAEPVKLEGIEPVNFPQFGQLRFVKFRVPMFKKKDMSLKMSEDGRLTYFHMKSQKSAVAEAAGAGASMADEIDKALEERETERRADYDYALSRQAKESEAHIKYLENQGKLEQMLSPKTPGQIAAAETSARTAQVNLDVELEKARLSQMLLLAADSNDPAAIMQILGALN